MADTQISVRNNGGYMARGDVSYSLNGNPVAHHIDAFPVGVTRNVLLPTGATGITLKLQVETFIAIWSDCGPIFQIASDGQQHCFAMSGTTLNRHCSEVPCGSLDATLSASEPAAAIEAAAEAACGPVTYHGITSTAFDCFKQNAIKEGAHWSGGNSGSFSITRFFQTVNTNYSFDGSAGTLMLQVVAKPGLVSCDFLQGKFHSGLEACGATPTFGI